MSNQKQPKVEWGFYAITPRIVRTQYKQLSHTEKWLYVCLKDLCGAHGTCYRTLKTLSEETDLSTGNLSTGIRHLHEAGLIHAEKKRRSDKPTGKEVWHITIVDIWQANSEYCSNFERFQKNTENNLQDLNDNLQILNELPPEPSKFEPKRSNFADRRKNIEEKTITEEKTDKEECPPSVAEVPSHARSSSSEVEPLMTDEWSDEQCVQYAEYHNGECYSSKMREAQLKAAQGLHREDNALTLEQFKQAYDERNDDWWKEHKRLLHVTDMKSQEQSSGVVRLYAMLDRIEARKHKKSPVVTTSRQPRGLPPEVQAALDEYNAQNESNQKWHRDRAKKAVAERASRGTNDGEPSYEELQAILGD